MNSGGTFAISAEPIDRPCTNESTPCPTNKIRDVRIEQLNYGYIVRVGCHSFAIETKEKLINLLSEYMGSPEITEKNWFNGSFLVTNTF